MTAIDKLKLDGKTVVVTGGARGIGYAVAELSASVGADVAITSWRRNATTHLSPRSARSDSTPIRNSSSPATTAA